MVCFSFGLKPWEVDEISIEDAEIYIRAYRERMEVVKVIWEVGRLAGFIPASQWNKKIRRVTDVAKFPWDKKRFGGRKKISEDAKKWFAERDKLPNKGFRLPPGKTIETWRGR
jgi:hypothetical protein